MPSGLSKNFFSVAVGQIIASSLQALFYLIFASLLEPERYGQMSYLIALAGMFSTISRFGLHFTVEVYQAKGNSVLSNQANTLAAIMTGIAALILLPINEFAAILSMAFSFFAMTQYNLLGLKQYKKYVKIAIVKSILFIIIPILLYFVFEIPGILLGMAISNFVGSFTFMKSLNIKVQSFHHLRSNYKFLTHNFGVDVALTFPTILDKLLIVPLFGFISVGIYQFNMQILAAIGLLPEILHSFLLSEESSGNTHKKINYLTVLSSGLFVLMITILAPFIIAKFFPQFSEGIFSLQILVVSAIPLSITSILNAKLQSRESSKIGFSGIIRIISLLIFILIFGNLYGVVGLSIAVLLSIILYTIFLCILFYKTKSVQDKM